MMPSSFRLPDLGEGLTEGEVARWLVSEGQAIAEDDPLVEIQTDKATVEIPSPYAGTVLRILVAEGEVAPVGTELVVIGEPGELESAPDDPSQPDRQRDATPATGERRRTASSAARGSRAGDARRASDRAGAGGRPRRRWQAPGPADGSRRTTFELLRAASQGEGRREPLRGVRRLIAEHMARAHREVPPVTWVEECDFEDVPLDRLLATVVQAVRRGARRVSGAERALRRRRDRLPRPLRHRRRRADRGRTGRARRPGCEREERGRARVGDRRPRRARPRGIA